MDLDKYRIHRTDSRNIAIQEKRDKKWITVSYHGNSANSLIAGLLELIVAQHTPEAKELREAVLALKSELVKGVEAVREMVEREIT